MQKTAKKNILSSFAFCKIILHSFGALTQTIREKMQDMLSAKVTGIEFKNGLSPEQVQKAKELLKKVNVKEVCKKVRVNVSTVYNVLRDESPRIDDLKKVLTQANKDLKKKEDTLKGLPL